MEILTFHGYCKLLWLGNFLHQPNTNEEKWGLMKYEEIWWICTQMASSNEDGVSSLE